MKLIKIKKLYSKYKKVSKYIFWGVFFVSFIMMGVGLLTVKAQSSAYPLDWVQAIDGVNDTTDPNIANYYTKAGTALFQGTSVLMMGISEEEVAANPQQYQNVPEQFKNGGLVGFAERTAMASFKAMPSINIPQHFAQHWLPAETVDNSTLAAFGRGFGYDFLTSMHLDQIWTRILNMCMLGFIVVVIVIGFMIMFKQRIGGQTLVTIANALPRVFIGILLAYASFAIGGLIIDLAKWGISLIEYVVLGSGGLSVSNVVRLEGPFQLAFDMWTGVIGDAGKYLFSGGGGILGFITNIVGKDNSIIKLIFIVVLGVLALVSAFKIFFAVLTAYLKIIMDVLLAPVIILIGSIPGRESLISSWFKRMISSALVIPVIFLFVNLAVYLSTLDIQPPPGMETGTAEVISLSIGFGRLMALQLYMLAAGAPKIIEEMFAVKPSSAMGAATQAGTKSLAKIPLIGGMVGGG